MYLLSFNNNQGQAIKLGCVNLQAAAALLDMLSRACPNEQIEVVSLIKLHENEKKS